MRTVSGVLVFAALALLAWSGSASAAVVKPREVIFVANLDLDAEGAITGIEWPRMAAEAKPFTDHIEKIIREWEFVPGSVNGVPAATQTGLTLLLSMGENSEGSLTLAILEAHTGAVAESMVHPRYPANQARMNNSAIVTVVLDVDEGGAVTEVEVVGYQSDYKSPKTREDFVAATRAAAMLWKFSPERVAGDGLASRVRIPFEFCMESQASCKHMHYREGNAEELDLPSGTAKALDSVVKINKQATVGEI